MPTFPLDPLGALAGKVSAVEKKIAAKVEELVVAANDLNQRISVLETAAEPGPEPEPEPEPEPIPEPITVALTGPTSIEGGTGLAAPLVAQTTGPVAGVTFGIESGPNVTYRVDMGAEVQTPVSPGRYEFQWSLNPIWTPAGDYVLFARARAEDGTTVMGTTAIKVAATSEPVPPPPEPEPIPVPPSAPGDAGTILALIGPTLSVADTTALGGIFATYDQVFRQRLPAASQDVWGNNYYDRAKAFYAYYARSGDPAFLQRAHTLAVDYRDKYLVVNNYGSAPHWSQIRGLELHYRLTGDEASRTAVAGVAVGLGSGLWITSYIGNTSHSNSDNRIQARILQAALAAYRLNAGYRRADGLQILAHEWPTRMRDMLNRILPTQNADGSWSWAQICGGQLNYMVGMLNDVLIEYYRDFEPDPRIPIAIEKANEYLWTTQWLPADQAFKYCSVQCTPNPWGVNVGGPTPAGDLNGLLIASFGWLYQHTGDAKWRTRGDAIMAGLVSTRWSSNYTGSKQFNQGYAESYRYLGWR